MMIVYLILYLYTPGVMVIEPVVRYLFSIVSSANSEQLMQFTSRLLNFISQTIAQNGMSSTYLLYWKNKLN